METTFAVEARDITKQFGSVMALNAISISVAEGEIFGVLGPNGAGKTTFLRMLFGLIRPDSGTLRVLGRTWTQDGINTLEGVAGFVESPKFYPYLSGRRNLEILARLDGGSDPDRINNVLEIVELDMRADHKVGGYSFGMRQRLGVAASLLRSPRLIVLDEPANGLDPAGIRDMRALVKRLSSDGLTVLLSSHDMGEVEEICDNVTVMQTGQVRFHGSISTLRENAPDPAYRLSTSDNEAALLVDHQGVSISLSDNHLIAHATQQVLDRYILALGARGIAVRSLVVDETSLEKLFFQLTEPTPTPADSNGVAA